MDCIMVSPVFKLLYPQHIADDAPKPLKCKLYMTGSKQTLGKYHVYPLKCWLERRNTSCNMSQLLLQHCLLNNYKNNKSVHAQ